MSKDPSFIANPDAFDGFRWCQDPNDRHALNPSGTTFTTLINGKNGNEKPHNQSLVPSTSTSFVSVSPSNMHFGFGRQACPGRFFAANTIKAIMSRIIMDYEFKFEERQEGRRPVNIVIGEHILPNSSPLVLFRKRSIGL